MPLQRIQIPSPNHSSSRPYNQLLVVHTSEGATTFRSLGNFLAQPSSQVSYHVGFDDTTDSQIGEYVQPMAKSWSAHSANSYGEHGCCCTPSGAAQGWTRDDWMARPRMLAACTAWLHEEGQRLGIPVRKITPADISAGVKGVCDHHDCVEAGLGGTHTDCGLQFPWDVVCGDKGPPPPTPKPEPLLGDDMFAVQDTDGGIYLAGAGVWSHLDSETWGAIKRFLPPLAAPVNARQRDLIRNQMMSLPTNVWSWMQASRINEGKSYKAGDILASAEQFAHDAAE